MCSYLLSPSFGKVCEDLVCTRSFVSSSLAGVLAGSVSTALQVYDRRSGSRLLEVWLPDERAFGVFITFATLVVALRTTNALNRYTEAAKYLHCLQGAWFDTASSAVAFSRSASAPLDDVEMFQQVLVTFISLLNALCLENLQKGGRVNERDGFRFELFGSAQLDDDTREEILRSPNRIGCVYHLIHQLLVDAQGSGVLAIAPPILTRCYQQLSSGLVVYHEAKKLSYAPLPIAYKAITALIKTFAAVFVAAMMATYGRSPWKSFVLAATGVFLLWFMYSVAEALDNPFRKQARSLDASSTQKELNKLMEQLLSQAKRPSATVTWARSRSLAAMTGTSSDPAPVIAESTLLTWQAGRNSAACQAPVRSASQSSIDFAAPVKLMRLSRSWTPRWRRSRSGLEESVPMQTTNSSSTDTDEASSPRKPPKPREAGDDPGESPRQPAHSQGDRTGIDQAESRATAEADLEAAGIRRGHTVARRRTAPTSPPVPLVSIAEEDQPQTKELSPRAQARAERRDVLLTPVTCAVTV